MLPPFRPASRSAVFVGAPRQGKTFGAIEWARAWQRLERRPIVVLDSLGVANFAAGWTRAPSLAALGRLVWKERRGAVAFTPSDFDEAEQLVRAVRELGGVHLVVDESAVWLDASRGRGGELERLLRSARHSACTVALTTQYAGSDVPQVVWACSPDVFAFRTTSPRAAAKLRELFGADPAQLAALAPRKFLRFGA